MVTGSVHWPGAGPSCEERYCCRPCSQAAGCWRGRALKQRTPFGESFCQSCTRLDWHHSHSLRGWHYLRCRHRLGATCQCSYCPASSVWLWAYCAIIPPYYEANSAWMDFCCHRCFLHPLCQSTERYLYRQHILPQQPTLTCLSAFKSGQLAHDKLSLMQRCCYFRSECLILVDFSGCFGYENARKDQLADNFARWAAFHPGSSVEYRCRKGWTRLQCGPALLYRSWFLAFAHRLVISVLFNGLSVHFTDL